LALPSLSNPLLLKFFSIKKPRVRGASGNGFELSFDEANAIALADNRQAAV
jgi:hypothetical protein